uniref:N-acetylmuramic acid 6-phosphate etherase n=1 Tax=Pararhizobium sp. IMCC3301 TaxID=3067904 RepID=UPI0027413F47|nr:N-acetylmuramic acid 6-phosphate etherase [Pararhizobium sp. IMCC3301]
MPLQATEHSSNQAEALDLRAPLEVLSILHRGQLDAARCVSTCFPALCRAAEAAATALSSGGRLIYAGAGSSGLMAMADALELPGTFGIAPDRVVILLAGGMNNLPALAGAPEDDTDQARRDVAAAGVGPDDCIIAVSASGTTPYALAALRTARASGAATIAVANNAPAPLLDEADIAIHLSTPPEIIAGSTRMGAGSAQKIALNMISTLMAIRLGHVHDGEMVNLKADNAKLKQRANRIVCAISQCTHEQAERYLEAADGSVKVAILLAAGAPDPEQARQMLAASAEMLRPALQHLKQS